MATGVLDIPAPPARSRRGTIALLSLAALIAVVFVGAAARHGARHPGAKDSRRAADLRRT